MPTFTVSDFNPASFPLLYRSADNASLSGQRWYLRWVIANLFLLLVGAGVGSISFADNDQKRIVHVITAVVFFVATGTSILLATRRWERIWYAGRAVAESAKSLSWK